MASISTDTTPTVSILTYDEVPVTIETYTEVRKTEFPWWLLLLALLGIAIASRREESS